MEDREITLVGYWNGDETKPHITFETPSSKEKEYKLVVVKILQPFESNERLDAVEINKQVKSLEKITSNVAKKQLKKIKEANSSLLSLGKILKRFS